MTINRPRHEVEQAWASAEDLTSKVQEAGASVSFPMPPVTAGPRSQVEFVHAPPAGDLGAVAQKLTGKDPGTELSDDLRRLKQQIEAGEILRSDGTPPGHLLAGHLSTRPAQPLEEAIR